MDSIEFRRKVLLGSISAIAVPLAGCTYLPGMCDDMHSVVIRAKPVDLSSEERSSIDPVVFVELPPEEQTIVRTAIEKEEYNRCHRYLDSSEKDALSSLNRRSCYLEHDQELYKLEGWIMDDSFCIGARA
ncbi:hypothetical protein [Halosolutus halophilus]|uniref:hypothetical protein n=1 Tax=Halosolutus halophilus TaxID=1552990 RepID=UPI002234F98F|nr:hypothetical protein [Halosolutus halophilus]